MRKAQRFDGAGARTLSVPQDVPLHLICQAFLFHEMPWKPPPALSLGMATTFSCVRTCNIHQAAAVGGKVEAGGGDGAGDRCLGRAGWDAWRPGSPLEGRPRSTTPPSTLDDAGMGGRGGENLSQSIGFACSSKPKTAENRARAIENSC